MRLRNEPGAAAARGDTFPALLIRPWSCRRRPDASPRGTLHSTMVPSATNNWSGQNTTGYVNLEADALIEAIETELDETERRVLWRHLQHLYAQDLPALLLYYRTDALILPRWLVGVEPTGVTSRRPPCGWSIGMSERTGGLRARPESQ
ncbi:MAG: peptide/nickel transport system substrate-binding protein [Rhodospirillaceae bacterium]|nr:MAG: peptide/nickel transport system substrate-binding protein [Rhodospirillaceae bacterium]